MRLTAAAECPGEEEPPAWEPHRCLQVAVRGKKRNPRWGSDSDFRTGKPQETLERYMSYEEEDTCKPQETLERYMSYEEEDTCKPQETLERFPSGKPISPETTFARERRQDRPLGKRDLVHRQKRPST
jgi:hypothetical protein